MEKRPTFLDFHPKVGSPNTIWIIPVIYILAALALGRLMPQIDHSFYNQQSYFSPSTATSLLSAISSGMIAFTGFVFSMLFVMVQFGSSAYTPRIARYFIQDPLVSHALGVFIATFIYSLIALSQVDFASSGIVPDYTVAAAMILLLSSALVFLALIRRIASLQINNVLQMLGERGVEVVEMLYPLLESARPGDAHSETKKPVSTDAGTHRSLMLEENLPPVLDEIVYHGRPMRVLEFTLRRLANLAEAANVMAQILPEVGDMVSDQQRIILVRGEKSGSQTIHPESLRACIVVGPQRTIEQDPKFAVRLIVDIALRALSPAVNDPTTAVQALDQLYDLLRRIAVRDLDVGFVYDKHGALRVNYPTPDWNDFLSLAIDEIRYYGSGSYQVMRRLRALLADLAQFVPVERIQAVEYQQKRVETAIAHSFPDPEDQSFAQEADRQGISIVK